MKDGKTDERKVRRKRARGGKYGIDGTATETAPKKKQSKNSTKTTGEGGGHEAKTEHTFASSNVSLSVFSDSPDMPETMDGAETWMKGTPSSYKTHHIIRQSLYSCQLRTKDVPKSKPSTLQTERKRRRNGSNGEKIETHPPNSPRQHSLPTPRRPMQQHPPRRLHARPQINFRMRERHRD